MLQGREKIDGKEMDMMDKRTIPHHDHHHHVLLLLLLIIIIILNNY